MSETVTRSTRQSTHLYYISFPIYIYFKKLLNLCNFAIFMANRVDLSSLLTYITIINFFFSKLYDYFNCI